MAENDRHEQLQVRLDELASMGANLLRRFALKEATESAMAFVHWVALIVPLVYFFAVLIEPLANTRLWTFGILTTILMALALPLVFVLATALVGYMRAKVDRRLALAVFDRELGYKDRLQTADEFLDIAEPTSFERAAIHDAIGYADQALETKIGPIRIAWPSIRTSEWKHGAAALGLLFAGIAISLTDFWTGQEGEPEPLVFATVSDLQAEGAATSLQDDFETPATGEKDAPEASDESDTSDSEETATNQRALMKANLVSSLAKKSLESGLSGGASQENQSGGASSSLSGQGSPQNKPHKPEDTKKNKQTQNREEDPKENEEKESVSGIAGGKGSGSGQQSSHTEMREYDNKLQQEDTDSASDLEADDEEDEQQESASASRPLLNKRKAAADRQLTPTTGADEENEDANGRGGPGGLKKTRGVAAMLLGVPMPDRLHSQINAGRIKVQRERAVPKPSSIQEVASESRGEMDEGIGKTTKYELKPWMRNVIKNYFIASRTASETTTE